MVLDSTEEQVDLLDKLEETGFVVTEAEVNDEVEPEETTLECSACSVILSIDQVILNTLAQEGKLAISSVDNLLKLTEIRDMYMRY